MSKRAMSRWTLSRRLQDVALRIAAGKPVRINGVDAIVPDRVFLEEELEASSTENELEFEISWPKRVPAAPSRKKVR